MLTSYALVSSCSMLVRTLTETPMLDRPFANRSHAYHNHTPINIGVGVSDAAGGSFL
jgi:hypothetical protein